MMYHHPTILIMMYYHPIILIMMNHHPIISILQAKDPTDVMYGWCHKCRAKYKEEYENLVG